MPGYFIAVTEKARKRPTAKLTSTTTAFILVASEGKAKGKEGREV